MCMECVCVCVICHISEMIEDLFFYFAKIYLNYLGVLPLCTKNEKLIESF